MCDERLSLRLLLTLEFHRHHEGGSRNYHLHQKHVHGGHLEQKREKRKKKVIGKYEFCAVSYRRNYWSDKICMSQGV